MKYLPLILLLGGCAAMQAIGLSTADGQPTEVAEGLNSFVEWTTGFSAIALWKAGEAIFTGSGRRKLKHIIDDDQGMKDTAKAAASIVFGFDLEDAKAEG